MPSSHVSRKAFIVSGSEVRSSSFVFDVPFVHKRLESCSVFDAVRRVEIDHLHLAAHALFFQE